MGLPSHGEYFAFGGGDLFRGYGLDQRQGNAVWIGSAEWRVPLVQGVHVDLFDHVVGLRNVYGAAFCDVGDSYVDNHSFGPVAYAPGFGLRFDVVWFSFVERSLFASTWRRPSTTIRGSRCGSTCRCRSRRAGRKWRSTLTRSASEVFASSLACASG